MRLSLKPIYYKITFGNKSKIPSFSKQKVLIWNAIDSSGEDVEIDIIPCASENGCHCCTHYIKTEKTINIHHYYNIDLSHVIVGEKPKISVPFVNPNQIFVTIDCSNCVPYSVDISSIAPQYEIKGVQESASLPPPPSSPRIHLHHPPIHPYYPPHHHYPHHYPFPPYHPYPLPYPYPPFPAPYPAQPYTHTPPPNSRENIVLPFMENETKKQIIIVEECSYNEIMVGVSPENVAGEMSSESGGDLDDFSMETEPAKEMPNGRPAFSSRILKRRTVPIHMGSGEMDNNIN